MRPDSSSQELIDTIVAAFGGDDPSNSGDVPKERVLEWMRSPDLQVRGALYTMISDASRAIHVKPSLQFADYYDFVLDYLEQCIEQGVDGDWIDSRYLAGHQLVAWFVDFWNDTSVPREKVAAIKRRLAALYSRGNEDVRDAVITAVLEHLFEHRQIATYFSDWERDPVLIKAYKDAILWIEKRPGGAK